MLSLKTSPALRISSRNWKHCAKLDLEQALDDSAHKAPLGHVERRQFASCLFDLSLGLPFKSMSGPYAVGLLCSNI